MRSGTVNAQCNEVTGTFVCGPTDAGSGGLWSATFTGQATGSGCTLGTIWNEQEEYTGTSGCSATWTQESGPPLSD